MTTRVLAPLPRRFFARPTVTVARELLGHLLVHEAPEGRAVGRIVEAEAYRGADDPASHAYRLTPRSRIMAGPAGIAYVYLTHGNHFCMNVVTDGEGTAGAVLLRALEPLEGIALMANRRGLDGGGATLDLRRLASGPGRLTQAMGVARAHNGWDLTRPPLFIAHGRPGLFVLKSSARVGIRPGAEQPWRFFIQGNAYVSSRPGLTSTPRLRLTRSAAPRSGGARRRARPGRRRRPPPPASKS